MIATNYLKPCPVCGAKPGQWCVQRDDYGYYHFATPHQERAQ